MQMSESRNRVYFDDETTIRYRMSFAKTGCDSTPPKFDH